jgi:peptide/nickel transport system ATP-binding protein
MDRQSEQGGHGKAMLNHSDNALLSVVDLKTYYFQDEGTVRAVDGVSFDVRQGRTLGVVGESGCGKTVTAKSIVRLVEKRGRIVDGNIIYRPKLNGDHRAEIDLTLLNADGPEMRSIRGGEIAWIFQEPMASFSPVHTIGSQIVEAIRLHHRVSRKEAHARALDMLHRVGIPRPQQRMDEYRDQLSGGLRQRAMIAMALSGDPRLLIADEPTTAVDVTTQAQILDLLQTLQLEGGMTILFITHNLGVIAEMADDMVVMYLGRVVEKAPVDDMFHAPKHPYTKALLRSIPSIRSVPREKLPTISGSIPHPYNRPSGCPFHPRCEYRIAELCDREAPQLLPVTEEQHVSCFLYHSPGSMPESSWRSIEDLSAESRHDLAGSGKGEVNQQ